MKLFHIVSTLLLVNFVIPLLGQNGVEHIELIQDSKFPREIKQAIQYASEKDVIVRFALMSEVYELMSYDDAGIFTKYNRNITVDDLIGYYNSSHEDFFGEDYTILPFATSTNHYHEDKADFLAVITSKSKKIDGKIIYSNIDYANNFPALVASSFNSIFVDFKSRIDAAYNAGEKNVFFALGDYFTTHAFDYDIDSSKELIKIEEPTITVLNTPVFSKITSKIAVENFPDGRQRILVNFTLSIDNQTISQNFYVADFLRFYVRDNDFGNQYVVSEEYRRKYSTYIWCADKFLKELTERGISYQSFLDNVSMSTTFRHALWTQKESVIHNDESNYEGVLSFDGKDFQFTLGEDKTRVEDADDDLYYNTFVESLAPKWINGVNDELVVKIIGLHRDTENIGWYNLICEIIDDKYDSNNNGCIIYVESFSPFTEPKYSRSKSRKIYSSLTELILANNFKDGFDILIAERTIEIDGLQVYVYKTESIGRKRFLPFAEIKIIPNGRGHIVKFDYQFSFARYQKTLRINESIGISEESLSGIVKSIVDQLLLEDQALETLAKSIDVNQLINLAL